jgi:hypothetical protein
MPYQTLSATRRLTAEPYLPIIDFLSTFINLPASAYFLHATFALLVRGILMQSL